VKMTFWRRLIARRRRRLHGLVAQNLAKLVLGGSVLDSVILGWRDALVDFREV